jgi:hypothetical protein
MCVRKLSLEEERDAWMKKTKTKMICLPMVEGYIEESQQPYTRDGLERVSLTSGGSSADSAMR